MSWGLLQSELSREQKKLAPSFPCSSSFRAIVYAIVLLPVPAEPGPLIHKTRAVCNLSPGLSGPGSATSPSLTQRSIKSRISVLVPLWQGFSLLLQSYRAVIACGSTNPPSTTSDQYTQKDPLGWWYIPYTSCLILISCPHVCQQAVRKSYHKSQTRMSRWTLTNVFCVRMADCWIKACVFLIYCGIRWYQRRHRDEASHRAQTQWRVRFPPGKQSAVTISSCAPSALAMNVWMDQMTAAISPAIVRASLSRLTRRFT